MTKPTNAETIKALNARCDECQRKLGGTRQPNMCVTCMKGKCPDCGDENVFLFYACDYSWPDGRRAVFD